MSRNYKKENEWKKNKYEEVRANIDKDSGIKLKQKLKREGKTIAEWISENAYRDLTSELIEILDKMKSKGTSYKSLIKLLEEREYCYENRKEEIDLTLGNKIFLIKYEYLKDSYFKDSIKIDYTINDIPRCIKTSELK